MRVCVSLEERFVRTADARVWSGAAGTAAYGFWKRYLDVFDHVQVVARVAEATSSPETTWKRADGEGVTFHALPCYVGPLQYAQRFLALSASIRSGLGRTDAVIMRVPSLIALRLERTLSPDRPFGVEVVGDVYEALAPGSIEHPLRPLLRWWLTRQLKRQCQKACAASYVTKETVQRRYPPHKNAFSTTYSSVELDENAFAAAPRSFSTHTGPIRLISVGTLEVLYKGFDVLIDAVAACVEAGLDLRLLIVGDGRRRPELERHAQFRGIEQRVTFAGRLPPGSAVRNELERADIFVLASKSEGLPRAMIEAMACGLPCIGTAVGGIPELLSAENLVPAGDAPALARRITEIINDPARMNQMSSANLERARDYHASTLTRRRREFYTYIREATLRWNQRHSKMAHRQPSMESFGH